MPHDAYFFRARRGLPQELVQAQEWIEGIAKGYGLKFCETIFEMCDWQEINMLASYGGFPTRYPHWRWGMDYIQMDKGYEYGLQKIYEMVINTDPSYAYLLDNNTMMDQKLVMAHVYGHVDFFTNNAWFAHTNRRMLDQMANHASRVRRHIDAEGTDTVEKFIDMCLSIENLIDPYAPHIRRERTQSDKEREAARRGDGVSKLPAKQYMDKYINPPEFLEAQRQRHADRIEQMSRFPEEPVRDVLGFLLKHGRMAPWQADILSIIRTEAYYFAPQAQTKIMNEGWACIAADSLVFSDSGLLSMGEVVFGRAKQVFDGQALQKVVDRNIIPDHPTVTVHTRRGLRLTGSDNHRILRADGDQWVRLDQLKIGDTVKLSGGGGTWPLRRVALNAQIPRRMSLQDVAERAEVGIDQVLRHRDGHRVGRATAVAAALVEYEQTEALPHGWNNREPVQLPAELDEELAALLGYLVGDGHISLVKRCLGLTTGDPEQAERFAALMLSCFGATASTRVDGGRLRVLVSSQTITDFLLDELGLTHGPSAAQKRVPDAVLQSPRPVVVAFLSALFDSDGHAGSQGVILSSASEKLSHQVQLLLLNLDILSRRRRQRDGVYHLHVTGASARRFAEVVGFGLERKRTALDRYIHDRKWFKTERWEDEIVSVERGRQDVYDISVSTTHRYAAAGFVNHNSYWHTTMMTRDILSDAEVIDYADHHSGTVAMSPGRINPYKIGIELYRHIEERWNRGQFGKEWMDCHDVAVKRDWDTGAGLGREKIFEVRRTHNDVTFIDQFLTEDFVRQNGLFTYEYDKMAGHFVIDSRDFADVKAKLLFMLSTRGNPRIMVTDGNFANRGELELTHEHEGADLQLDWASLTLGNVAHMWGRAVHLRTRLDDRDAILHHDGENFEVEKLPKTRKNRKGKDEEEP